jgi:predicted GNAT family N-acyltransferase
VLEEQLLDATQHDRSLFSCGVAALDEYLLRFAVQQSKKGVSIVRVLIDSRAPQTILGYYSLSAAQVEVDQLDERTRKKLPRYPVPCFRMGRFAVNAAHHGQGLGKVLIGCAVERCLLAKNHVAAYALIVDAKDAQAKKFYQHYGFAACRDNPLALYLPLGL